MSDPPEFLRRIERIEGLVARIEASSDEATRDAARELTSALLELHRVGLSRVIELVAGAGAPARPIAEGFARDELLSSLLALHDLAFPAAEPLVPLRRSRDGDDVTRAVERCELCDAPLPAEHTHLLRPARRELACACRACALLFDGPRPEKATYRRVPDRVRYLDGFRMTDAQWDALGVPVHLAFFFHSTPAGRVVALYPSPAGAMESLLPLPAWQDIAAENPILHEMEPDVEALLAHRIGAAREHFLAPIDRCFELTGLCRSRRSSILGLGGGAAEGEIRRFLDGLREQATRAAA